MAGGERGDVGVMADRFQVTNVALDDGGGDNCYDL